MSDRRTVDLRSDTVTRPSADMRRAMADAEVGDDVLDGDPTTRRLEERVATLLGHERALFFPSGTQANEVAVGLLAPAGTELIVEADAHLVHYEVGAVPALWGVQFRPIAAPGGILRPEAVHAAIRPSPRFTPRTGAVAIENTHNLAGGTVMPPDVMDAVIAVAAAAGLPVHLDGARLWNAAVALGVPLTRLARSATTVMVSFSKGLGCPVGSCLVGPQALMDAAWTLRKRLGGGMRQSGVLAAACLWALDHTLPRLGADHATARLLAERLAGHPAVRPRPPQTNIVMLDLPKRRAADVVPLLAARGVLVAEYGPQLVRAVTHLHVTEDDIVWAAEVIGEVLT